MRRRLELWLLLGLVAGCALVARGVSKRDATRVRPTPAHAPAPIALRVDIGLLNGPELLLNARGNGDWYQLIRISGSHVFPKQVERRQDVLPLIDATARIAGIDGAGERRFLVNQSHCVTVSIDLPDGFSRSVTGRRASPPAFPIATAPQQELARCVGAFVAGYITVASLADRLEAIAQVAARPRSETNIPVYPF